jgi:hypothetical protein
MPLRPGQPLTPVVRRHFSKVTVRLGVVPMFPIFMLVCPMTVMIKIMWTQDIYSKN